MNIIGAWAFFLILFLSFAYFLFICFSCEELLMKSVLARVINTPAIAMDKIHGNSFPTSSCEVSFLYPVFVCGSRNKSR